MHCHTFLKALKSRLEASDNPMLGMGMGKGGKGGKSPVKAKKGSDAVVIVGPRSGGLKVWRSHGLSYISSNTYTQ